MGRVIREDRLTFDEGVQQGLIRSAAARASNLGMDEFETKLQVRNATVQWRVILI